jgi:hypothetical protein
VAGSFAVIGFFASTICRIFDLSERLNAFSLPDYENHTKTPPREACGDQIGE